MTKNEQAINIDFSKAWLEQTKHSPLRAVDVIYKTIHEALEAKQVDVEITDEMAVACRKQIGLEFGHDDQGSLGYYKRIIRAALKASQGYITQPLKKKD
jgi:hypothetical protein